MADPGDSEFHEGDAQHLPFPDNSFDAVLCGYGLMHVPDAEEVLREMLRVLRPRGRAAVSVWEKDTPNNGFGLVYVAVRSCGNLNVPLPHGADFFQFGATEKMTEALRETGFANIEAQLLKQDWPVHSGEQIMQAVLKGAVRSRALLSAQSPTEKQVIVNFFEKTLNGLSKSGSNFLVPLPAIVGSGAKL